MTGFIRSMNRWVAMGMTLALAGAWSTLAAAQYQQPPQPPRQQVEPDQDQDEDEDKDKDKDEEQSDEDAPKPEYSKDFLKIAGKVQKAADEKNWAEVMTALPELEALPSPTPDDRKAIATWRLQATQGVGDQDAFAAAIEKYLADGYAAPDQEGAMHRQLAAHYSAKQDRAKTVEHFRKFVDGTPDVEPEELETLGRLYLQADNQAEGAQWLGKAIELSASRNEMPKQLWFQLRDAAFIKLNDDAARLANLESLVTHYPDREYYSRIVAIYQNQSKDDRVVMLNAYRLAVSDPQGGLENVGGYMNYASTAIDAGSPGEAARALERGMKDGIVPGAGTNQQTLNEAKAAVAQDKKSLPAEATAAEKNPKGEVAVKVGLGFYSIGDYQRAADLAKSGIAKGGVERLDDANLLMGAALMELGRRDEAKAAFEAAAAAATSGSHMARIANLWLARAARVEPAATGG